MTIAFCESAAAAQSVKTEVASMNGTSLYYEVKGNGFPLVLISGGGLLDSRAWDEQFDNFSKHYKVIRYDIRGIGKSARPQQSFSHSRDLKKDGIAKMVQLVSETSTFIAKDNLAAQEKIRRNYSDNRDIFESDFPLVSLWQPTNPAAATRLGEIRGPVLIMMAENDIPAYKEITEKLAKALARAKTIVIPGAAHAINLDKPKEFDEAVLAFLGAKRR